MLTMAPEYPKHGTQAARLLAALLLGHKIDPLTAWERLGIYRVADTKLQLCKRGWPVNNLEKAVVNRFGETCRVALYALPPEAIGIADKEGQEFAQEEVRIANERRAA